MPDTIKTIETDAFRGTGITEITIPLNVESMGAITDCHSITKITVDRENSVYYSENNCIIERSTQKLITGAGGNNVVIPDNVKAIGDWAFSGRNNLTSITISNSVVEIGKAAFGWSNLSSISIPSSVILIKAQAFAGCNALSSVTFENTSGWKAGDTSISVNTPSQNATWIRQNGIYSNVDWTR